MRKLLFLMVLASACSTPSPKGLFPESDLKVGEVTGVKKLAAHAADTFRLRLDSGMLVYGNANQLTFDAIVEVYNPDKDKIGSFDSPSRGPEVYQFRTRKTGTYKVVVTPFEEQAGEYTLVVSGAEPIATTYEGVAQQFINTFVGTDEKVPGASVAVMKDGKMVFSNGYGYADLESDRKVTPTTIFHVASVSKQFTAFAMAMLADQDKISLDDDIRKYLPELYDFGSVITINHLVHHTSGLRDQWNLLMMAGWRLDDVITQKQIMRIISRQRELNFKPGEQFLYCNTGFTLMAEIVQRVTGQTLAQWTKANVFDKLGMANTFFYDDHEKVVPNRAYSYYKDGQSGEFKKSVLSYANAGATSLFTTAEDLCKWAQNYETMVVGNQRVMAMMQQPFILNNGDTTDYAMGIAIGKHRGHRIISHSGGDAGYRSFLIWFPDDHLAVAVASNLAQFGPAGMAFHEADVALAGSLEPERSDVIAPGPAPSPRKPVDSKSLRLADYTGSYYSEELDTRYWFDIVNDTLTIHHQRHNDQKLTFRGVDTVGMNNLGEVVFTREKGGKVVGFKASNGRVRNLAFRKMP